MPEGDTIHKLARALAERLAGSRLTEVRLLGEARPGLGGRRVDAVRARGKHLLFEIEGGAVLHVHLGMNGAWHVFLPGEPEPRPSPRLGVLLRSERDTLLVCFSPSIVELLDARSLPLHPSLSRLGPDLLEDSPDLSEISRRAASRAAGGGSVGELLLDQEVAAGIGNVYKSEVLFLERVHPSRPAAALTGEALAALYRRARELLRANLGPGMRRTTPPGAASPLWVYGRKNRPCLRCRARIQGEHHGEPPRVTFWCPACQPAR